MACKRCGLSNCGHPPDAKPDPPTVFWEPVALAEAVVAKWGSTEHPEWVLEKVNRAKVLYMDNDGCHDWVVVKAYVWMGDKGVYGGGLDDNSGMGLRYRAANAAQRAAWNLANFLRENF